MPEGQELPGFGWIRRNWSELREGQWGAVIEDRIVAYSDTCEGLELEIRESLVRGKSVVIVLRRDGKPVNDDPNRNRET